MTERRKGVNGMSGEISSKPKRIAAAMMAVMVLFILLFSSFYHVREANHDCTGRDCPVCASISQCEAALEQIGTGVIYEIVILLPVFFLAVVLIPVVPESVPFTLIREKVRMNN